MKRVAFIGSAKHFNDWTIGYCQNLGKAVAELQVEFVTGGEEGGPPATIVEAIYKYNPAAKITYIKPENAREEYIGEDKWKPEEHCKTPGRTEYLGKTDKNRQQELANYADIFIMIEGGPGAEFEAKCAITYDKIVLPLKESSPFAEKIHKELNSRVTKYNMYGSLIQSLYSTKNIKSEIDKV